MLLLAACNPTTARPSFGPVPEAPTGEVYLTVPEATEQLAAALRDDSLPVTHVYLRDGYVETPWLDTAGLQPTGRRPLGPGTVRVRGWVNPGRPGYSQLIVETTYRRIVDPSLPPRDLDRAVPATHPVRVRIDSLLARLTTRYGGRRQPPQAVTPIAPTPPPAEEPADSAVPAPADSTQQR